MRGVGLCVRGGETAPIDHRRDHKQAVRLPILGDGWDLSWGRRIRLSEASRIRHSEFENVQNGVIRAVAQR